MLRADLPVVRELYSILEWRAGAAVVGSTSEQIALAEKRQSFCMRWVTNSCGGTRAAGAAEAAEATSVGLWLTFLWCDLHAPQDLAARQRAHFARV